MSMKKAIRGKIKQHRNLIVALLFITLLIMVYCLGSIIPFTMER